MWYFGGLGVFFSFFSLSAYTWCLLKPQFYHSKSQEQNHLSVLPFLFACGVRIFSPCQKLLRWLGTISLKSTVAKHELLLEVFVKLYLLKYTVKFLLFETCDNWYCQTASLQEYFFLSRIWIILPDIFLHKKNQLYISGTCVLIFNEGWFGWQVVLLNVF